jgi:hypothetical protein
MPCPAPVETELLVHADRLVGGSDAVLVIDDAAIPKKCRCAICFGARQDRQLPDPCIADARARRSTGHAGFAAVSSRELDKLASAKWHTINWRTGTKGKLKAPLTAAS